MDLKFLGLFFAKWAEINYTDSYKNPLDNSSFDEYHSASWIKKGEIYKSCHGGDMGRTVMPFSFVLESERERWKPFRRALSKEDQEAFDRLFARAKMHTSAAVYMAHSWPMETILLSICLEHEKMVDEILARLKEKKANG
jgi:hypothetical protein